jgi:hypothetical protein
MNFLINNYKAFEEIELDLKRLSLERQIAIEEFKGVKGEIKEDLKTSVLLKTIWKYANKYGAIMLIKKIIR